MSAVVLYDVRLMSLLAYLLNLELLLSVGGITTRASFGALNLGCSACIGHLDVGHGCCESGMVCGVKAVVLWCESSWCGVAWMMGGKRLMNGPDCRVALEECVEGDT
jgi:hypothetical protein